MVFSGRLVLMLPAGLKIQAGYLSQFQAPSNGLVLADEYVWELYAPKWNCQNILLPRGERAKTFATVEAVCRKLSQLGVDRDFEIIAFGGGACLDVAGFIAATYLRGLSCTYIPTTLLSMVDASIGGKTAINLPEGKNLVGTFTQPTNVVIDPDVLTSLPKREFCAGLAEVIKAAIIEGPDFFNILETAPVEELIRRSLALKWKLVRDDLYDHKQRMLLNFGHSFAHAIEAALDYKDILHGEAVSIGMMAALQLSHDLGYAPVSLVSRVKDILEKTGLPTELPNIETPRLLEYMKRDKKNRAGKITCILAQDLGKVFCKTSVSPQQIAASLENKWLYGAKEQTIVCK